MAKDDYSHASLCRQFKEHTVRTLLIGAPPFCLHVLSPVAASQFGATIVICGLQGLRYVLQVQRTYQAVTIGVPKEGSGRVETNIVRDPKDRLKMCISGFYSNRSVLFLEHDSTKYQKIT